MIKRVLIFFPVLLFVLIRQIYANLLGINKDVLTATLVFGLVAFALLAFGMRMQEVRPDFLILDLINLVQFHLAAVAIYAYFIAGRIEVNQAIYAAYYYCSAPFLIYSGFLLWRLKPVTRRAALVALGCAYAVTFWVAVYEALDIDFWLFQYQRWVLQKNYLDITRASGLYGTQIDYGLLSFLTFTVSFYWNTRHRHWFASLVMCLAILGVVLSMSRAWLVALVTVVFFWMIRMQSLRRRLKGALIVVVAGISLYAVADRLGFVDMLKATDPYTQDSNAARVGFLQATPKWLDQYLIVGTGPGTQNGPDAHDQKFIGDFLWLATLVECGTLLGIVLVLLRVVVILSVLNRKQRLGTDSVLQPIARTACVTFLFASFVNSAYAHFVSVSAFYVISGLYLYQTPDEFASRNGGFGRAPTTGLVTHSGQQDSPAIS